MGLFGTIMEKLGFGAAAHAATPPPAAVPASATPSAPAAAAPAAPRPAAMSAVDVVGKLEGLAAKNSQKLNWKSSIVDLMKLLNLDSSLTARKELATELGCPADKMGDSAQMNMWLHKAVLQKLAANGGNIPKELLH
jgi:pyruvate/2-oxoglutarate dehydrogenase complex dihydrolipoamide acyltransferase (E2) component